MKSSFVKVFVLLAGLIYSGLLTAELIEVPAEYEDRYRHLLTELRCLVCQNQNLADSGSGLANDLRIEVKEMLLAGKSDDEILEFMSDRYGDFVLYKPRFTAKTYLLWIGPFLLMLFGAFIVWRVVRNPNKNQHAQPLSEEEKQALAQWNKDGND